MDKIDVNELGMRHKFEEEIERFNKFQKIVMGMERNIKSVKIDLKTYAKYLLKEGSVIEKRELLACMKSKLVLKDKNIQLEK